MRIPLSLWALLGLGFGTYPALSQEVLRSDPLPQPLPRIEISPINPGGLSLPQGALVVPPPPPDVPVVPKPLCDRPHYEYHDVPDSSQPTGYRTEKELAC